MKNICCRIFIYAVCIVLVSCGTAVPSPVDTEAISPSQSIPSPAPQNLDSLKMLTSPDGLLFSSGAPAPDGFYDIFFNYDGSANIIYYDYAGRQTLYLSSQVNTDHKDVSDTSYLSFAVGGAFPLTDGEYLYILKAPNSPLLRRGQEGGKGYLLRMGLNGQDRVEIPLAAALKPALTSALVGANGNFIFLASETGQDSVSQYKLFATNFEKGRLEELYCFEPEISVFLLGSAGAQVVLCTAASNEGPSRLLLFEPAAGKMKPLSFELSQKQFLIADEKLLFIHFGDTALYSYDPLSETTRQVISSVLPETSVFDELQIGQHIVDGCFFVRAYNLQKGDYERFAVDLETGSLRPQELTDQGTPVQIISDAGAYYMVSLTDFEVTYDDFTPDGVPVKNTMLCPHYALIRKEDYWAAVPRYIEFENQVFQAG